ncbi:Uncharacterized protein FKW44_002869 [Caligus rogercresseyi]|uniref:Uncharacterized protein n=1 Tax=Caligus rogercresseyi TaxID=217165 RepID=A0A7T8KL66_CALRO|nr:Uncharacterized protein FKW44_002869 [Caligus rogercresseyi]
MDEDSIYLSQSPRKGLRLSRRAPRVRPPPIQSLDKDLCPLEEEGDDSVALASQKASQENSQKSKKLLLLKDRRVTHAPLLRSDSSLLSNSIQVPTHDSVEAGSPKEKRLRLQRGGPNRNTTNKKNFSLTLEEETQGSESPIPNRSGRSPLVLLSGKSSRLGPRTTDNTLLQFDPNFESTRIQTPSHTRIPLRSRLSMTLNAQDEPEEEENPPASLLNLSSQSLYQKKLSEKKVVEGGTQMTPPLQHSPMKDTEVLQRSRLSHQGDLSIRSVYKKMLESHVVVEGGTQTTPLQAQKEQEKNQRHGNEAASPPSPQPPILDSIQEEENDNVHVEGSIEEEEEGGNGIINSPGSKEGESIQSGFLSVPCDAKSDDSIVLGYEEDFHMDFHGEQQLASPRRTSGVPQKRTTPRSVDRERRRSQETSSGYETPGRSSQKKLTPWSGSQRLKRSSLEASQSKRTTTTPYLLRKELHRRITKANASLQKGQGSMNKSTPRIDLANHSRNSQKSLEDDSPAPQIHPLALFCPTDSESEEEEDNSSNKDTRNEDEQPTLQSDCLPNQTKGLTPHTFRTRYGANDNDAHASHDKETRKMNLRKSIFMRRGIRVPKNSELKTESFEYFSRFCPFKLNKDAQAAFFKVSQDVMADIMNRLTDEAFYNSGRTNVYLKDVKNVMLQYKCFPPAPPGARLPNQFLYNFLIHNCDARAAKLSYP